MGSRQGGLPPPAGRDVLDGARGRVVTRPPIPHNPVREAGGGRVRRQPGQVRKEAALTNCIRVVRQSLTLALTGADRIAKVRSGALRGGAARRDAPWAQRALWADQGCSPTPYHPQMRPPPCLGAGARAMLLGLSSE